MARMRWRQHKPRVSRLRSKNLLLRYFPRLTVRWLWRHVERTVDMNISKRALRRQIGRLKGERP